MKLIDLYEAPLKDISYHDARIKVDDSEPEGSFEKHEREFIKKLIAKKTYHEKLGKLAFDLYAYVVDSDTLGNLMTDLPDTQLSKTQLKAGVIKTLYAKNSKTSILKDPKSIKTVVNLIGSRLKEEPKSVHFIIGDNYSPQHQVNLTPWIIVHRLLHAAGRLSQPDVTELGLRGDFAKALAAGFSFKSAKGDKPSIIDTMELGVEVATEYLVTGKIRFDPDAVRKKWHELEIPETSSPPWMFHASKGVGLEGVIKGAQNAIERVKKHSDELSTILAGKIFYI